jgi:DNA-binding MarR family transcriptional regulator
MVPFPKLLYIITIVKEPRNSEIPVLDNPLEGHLGYQLRRTSALLMSELGTRLAPTGLRPTEVTILLVIRANPGCQQGAIGEMLGIKPANMVPLIARLVNEGLVDRAKADGRSHALSLTPAGGARIATVKQLLDQHDSEMLSRLDTQSLAGLLAALEKLRC